MITNIAARPTKQIIRVLVWASNQQAYWDYLRQHNIGWLEAVQIKDPVQLEGYSYTIPLIKLGDEPINNSQLAQAMKHYQEKYENSQANYKQPNSPLHIPVYQVTVPAVTIPVSAS